jgi:hypothetical protein
MCRGTLEFLSIIYAMYGAPHIHSIFCIPGTLEFLVKTALSLFFDINKKETKKVLVMY